MTRRGSNLLVWIVTIVGIVYVSTQAWAGHEVTGTSVLDMCVRALPFAGIYALAASGLVVVYTTTGIFNFAQGAIGMFMAYVYWQMTDTTTGWGLPTWLCLPLVVLVIAPLFGVLLDQTVMRHLQGKPLVVQLMVTVGMMFAIIGLANMIWNQSNSHSLPALFQGAGNGGINIGDVLLTWHRLIVVIVAVVVAIGMRILLFSTRIGIAMRAVVDNRDLAALGGARASVLSSFSWAIGCMLAALAGILIAPEVSDMSTSTLAFLVITAFSAAVVGRLRSLPLTYLGALILALANQYFFSFLSFKGRWSNVSLALPTIMLLVVLLLLPRARLEFGRIGAIRRIERVSSVRDTAVGMVALFVFVVAISSFMSGTNVSRFALGMCTALVALSLVPLTGWAGQVSLAPMAFAAVGAVAYARLPEAHDNASAVVVVGILTAACVFIIGRFVIKPQLAAIAGVVGGVIVAVGFHQFGTPGSPWVVLVATLVTVPVGAALAFPAMRLQGLYLALATLAFATMIDQVFYTQPFAVAQGQVVAPPLHLFGVTFDSKKSLLLLVTVVFGLCGIGIVKLRNSAFGRRLIALRDSEAASVTVGVNVFETKLLVFALSAGMAAFAGAFFAMDFHILTQPPNNGFEAFTGIAIVLALVIGGVGFVAGALFAGIFGLATQIIQDNWHISLWLALVYLAPGLAVLGIIQNPSGAVVPIGEGFARLLPWRKDAQQDYEEMRAANAEPEIGVLGIEREFEEADVLLLDRQLGISNEVREPVGTS